MIIEKEEEQLIKEIFYTATNTQKAMASKGILKSKEKYEQVVESIEYEQVDSRESAYALYSRFSNISIFSRIIGVPIKGIKRFLVGLVMSDEEFTKLYVEDGLPGKEMVRIIDMPFLVVADIKRIVKELGISHTDEQTFINRSKASLEYVTNKEKFSVAQERAKDTNVLRYGFETPSLANTKFSETPYVHSLQDSVRITDTPESLKEFLYDTFPEKKVFTISEISEITGRSYSSLSSKLRTNLDFITPSSRGVLPERIHNFLEYLGFSEGVDFIVNDRNVLKPQEIDFYFPKQKVGIEVNDLWSHNSTYMLYDIEPKPKNYHMNKSLKAKEKGIRLIHAWEHYMEDPQQYEVLKNAIKHALGISANRVYARNTYVKEVPNTSLKDFFNTNNIQGFRGAKTAYALFDKKTDEVLMAYSVGNPHFAHGKYDLELIRGASKLDTTIVGGASKLWKYIIDNNPEVNSIVYYIDRNIYNGSSISTLEGNLELVSTQVGFWNYFLDTKEMKNRQPKKHKEIKELVSQGKVWEVYNAGTETYVWTR